MKQHQTLELGFEAVAPSSGAVAVDLQATFTTILSIFHGVPNQVNEKY